jgi:membrane protein required for colicin V production
MYRSMAAVGLIPEGSGLSYADWIILFIILLNVVSAAIQGFFMEALSLAGLVVGYLAAAWQYQNVARWLGSYLQGWLSDVVAFVMIFVLVVLVFGIAGRIARKVMKEVGLSFFDRSMGAALGLLKGGLAVSIILMGLTAFTPTSKFLDNSQLAPYFLVVGHAAKWLAPQAFRIRFDEGLDFLRRAPKDLVPAPGK